MLNYRNSNWSGKFWNAYFTFDLISHDEFILAFFVLLFISLIKSIIPFSENFNLDGFWIVFILQKFSNLSLRSNSLTTSHEVAFLKRIASIDFQKLDRMVNIRCVAYNISNHWTLKPLVSGWSSLFWFHIKNQDLEFKQRIDATRISKDTNWDERFMLKKKVRTGLMMTYDSNNFKIWRFGWKNDYHYYKHLPPTFKRGRKHWFLRHCASHWSLCNQLFRRLVCQCDLLT